VLANIQYHPPASTETRSIRIPWGALTGVSTPGEFAGGAFSISASHAVSAAYGEVMHGRAGGAAPPEPSTENLSVLPDVFDFQFTGGPRRQGSIDLDDLVAEENPQPAAKLGYIRIKQFRGRDGGPGSTDRIVAEFQRILTFLDKAAPDGLIIDVRSNPGGDILAAERMLQMLTPRKISPALFHLANTPGMLQILRSLPEQRNNRVSLSPADDDKLTEALVALGPWIEDGDNTPFPQGEPITSGHTLTDPGQANQVGQIYQGNVALLVDALTYSAAEIFTAGFQDHAIGPVIGRDANTGGGGASVWTHDDLLLKLGPAHGLPLEPLPSDATMSLAISRCSRVGSFQGQPVEDVGVIAEVPYSSHSVTDLLAGCPGLIRRACGELAKLTRFRIDVTGCARRPDGSLAVDLSTINIAKLDFLLDGNLILEGQTPAPSIVIPAAPGSSVPETLRVEGFAITPGVNGNQPSLAAVRTVHISQSAGSGDDSTSSAITGSITGLAGVGQGSS